MNPIQATYKDTICKNLEERKKSKIGHSNKMDLKQMMTNLSDLFMEKHLIIYILGVFSI